VASAIDLNQFTVGKVFNRLAAKFGPVAKRLYLLRVQRSDGKKTLRSL
jgi:hypothetical protein